MYAYIIMLYKSYLLCCSRIHFTFSDPRVTSLLWICVTSTPCCVLRQEALQAVQAKSVYSLSQLYVNMYLYVLCVSSIVCVSSLTAVRKYVFVYVLCVCSLSQLYVLCLSVLYVCSLSQLYVLCLSVCVLSLTAVCIMCQCIVCVLSPTAVRKYAIYSCVCPHSQLYTDTHRLCCVYLCVKFVFLFCAHVCM